jgi:very-short-patch-repair endonuclease
MDKKFIKARKLRQNQTPQEQKMWNLLRGKQFQGIKFVRQYPIENYIADFACRSKKLIIEIDGGQHNEDKNIIYDDKRTKFLESLGYKIIRFWNNEIDDNLEGVYERLLEFIKE